MEREYLVIVHPAGQLDDVRAVGFWTEVPPLAACSADGDTVEGALANTRQAIVAWLAGNRGTPKGHRQPEGEVRLRVEMAM